MNKRNFKLKQQDSDYMLQRKNGITLIALVISIIVMLILAGVSLNATIGENGIMAQAKNATYMQSIASLEEYLNNYYIEHYEEMNDENASKVITLKSLQPDWFFSTRLGYVPDSEGNALYLINKSGLPEEIRNNLKDGNAGDGTYSDYSNLNDVYGVTSNLQVYYCSKGISTILGKNINDLDKDNPNRTVLETSSILGKVFEGYDTNGDGNLSVQESRAIKQVTFDKNSNISSLEGIDNLLSLEKIVISDLKLDSLKGIENCTNVNYVFIKGCDIENYSALKNLKNKLQYLYFHNINDAELEKVCSITTGIGNCDFENLQYFAVAGNIDYISDLSTPSVTSRGSSVQTSKSAKTITSIIPLKNLSEKTKNNIKYLSLNNNNITSIEGISEFNNIFMLRLEYNCLSDLKDIGSLKNLEYLYCAGMKTLKVLDEFKEGSKLKYLITADSGLNTLKGLENCNELCSIWAKNNDFGKDLETSVKDKNIDSIAALKNKSKLYLVDLSNSSNLKWVDYIKDNTTIQYLYLENCNGIVGTSLSDLKTIINNCKKVSYPSNYALTLLDDSLQKLDLSNQTIRESVFRSIKNKSNITHLTLKDVNLTNDSDKKLTSKEVNNLLNEVLGTLTGLKYLQVYATNINFSTSELSTIDFVNKNKVTNLLELDLRGTNATDLSNLNEYGKSLKNLILNNANIELNKIQPTISNMSNNETENSYFISGNLTNRGLLLLNSDLTKKLEGLSEITGLTVLAGNFGCSVSKLDLSGCVNLKKIVTYSAWEGANLILPASIENLNLSFENNSYIDFSRCEKLSTISLNDCIVYSEDQLTYILNSIKNLKNANRLIIQNVYQGKIENLDCLEILKDSNITYFEWSTVGQRYNLKDINGLKYLKKLKSLSLEYIYAKDISGLEPIYDENNNLVTGCPELEEVNINTSEIGNLDVLGKITTLKNIRVVNSSVSSIANFANLINLETLNLSNNSLYNLGSYTGSDGITRSYNVLEVLAKLNKTAKLKNLYLAGNNIDDFTKIKEGTNFAKHSGW